MSQEKLEKSIKYVNLIKSKLSDPTPSKHKDSPVEYREYLERELKKATAKVDSLKLDTSGKK